LAATKGIDGYDFIIVGGGSAGGFLTLRLSEDPSHKVLLLEAGPTDFHWSVLIPGVMRVNYMGGPRNWAFHTEPEPQLKGRTLYQPRGKVLGGSSSINGMVFVRGHARDYDRWAEEGAAGWAFDDVLSYFKKMERFASGPDAFRGGEGPVQVQRASALHPIELAFLAAGEQAGYRRTPDYNGAEQEGFFAYDINAGGGWRSGSAQACIRPARRRPNVTVETGAQVTRVLVDKGRAVGVEYSRRGEKRQARAERDVILSAGAFGSPQILLLSGIGPADELRAHGVSPVHDLKGVGRNLQDHLEIHMQYRCPAGLSKNSILKWHNLAKGGLEWLFFRRGPAAIPHSRVGAFLKSSEAVAHPDIQYHFWPFFMDGWSIPPGEDGYCFDVGPLRSDSRGWVKLRSADPFQAPRIRLNALSTERDMIEFRRCLRMTREIESQPGFDVCRGPEVAPGPGVVSDTEIDDYARAVAASAYHPCGTCKMGTDEDSVVDPKTRVRGLEGLRVVDASIMPSIVSGNTNAASMMIGERAADLILGR
jgi:choline dehydrogenase